MDIGKYKLAMRPKKYLDGKFVIYDSSLPDPSDAQLETRDNFAIGGGVIEGNDLGTREGFEKINYRGDPEIQNKVKKLFEEGKTNQQVADELKINKTTIKRIKKDLGLDTVKKTQLETIKQKYLKLKDLVEDTNKGFKYTQMKDLLKQVGLKGDYGPSDIKNMQKYNIPKLDSAQDKVRKTFKFLISDPNKPVEELFSFNSKIAELTGTNQNQVSMILSKDPEYLDFKPIMNKLIVPASRARIAGKNMVLADLIEEVENVRPTGSGGVPRGARSTPEYFIFDNAVKHVNQGGTKVEFTKMPGTLDDTGKLISITDAEFIYKGKKHTYNDLLKNGRKYFPEVYNTFDDLDKLLNRQVIHPVTKEKINFSTLMKEAYNKGAGYSLDRSPYAIDHFKQVKEEPFTDLRITSARLNSSAGVLKQKEFQATQGAITDPEKAKLYAPERVERNLKKMGYDFTKNPNKLFNDEVKLANDILVKNRILKKPIQIAQDYEKLELENLKKIPGVTTADKIKRPESAITREMFDRFNKLRGVLIPGLEEIKDSLKKLPDDIKSKRYFTAALKGLGIVATPLIVSGMYNDFKSGKTVMETLERNLIGTDGIGAMKDIFALSPEEREARSVVKQAEMDEQIAQDFSGLDTDFQTPRVESKMSLEEALKEYEEGLKRVELERQQEEAERAEGRASSFESLKDLMLGERFQPQEIPQQFLASGGRVGFADGTPPDPSKRKFMKIMGALAAVPVIGKYFNLAKPLTKAAPAAVEAAKGIPPYFFKMVEKVKQFGDDVTKRFATQEREQVYNYRTSDADYELYEDLNTGDVRLKVIKGDPDFPGYKEQELTLTKGGIDEKTGNVPDEYDEYTVKSDFDGKMKDIDEGIEGIDDLIEDTIGFENVSIKELEDMGYDVNRLSPGFKKKLGIK